MPAEKVPGYFARAIASPSFALAFFFAFAMSFENSFMEEGLATELFISAMESDAMGNVLSTPERSFEMNEVETPAQ